jgi:hypothetical protein
MSPTLRAVAVASTAALVVAGLATSAGAAAGNTAASFTASPAYGATNSTITLRGSGFASTDTVTIGHSSAVSPVTATASKLTVTVPSNATSGRIVVHEGATAVKGPNFVVQQATSAVTSLSSSKITYTKLVTVSATLTSKVAGSPVAHQTAVLQHRAAGTGTWRVAKGAKVEKTGHLGKVSWKLTPAADGRYRVHFLSTHVYGGTLSSVKRLVVLPRVQLAHITTIPSQSDSQIVGTILPRVSGNVYLQKLVGHSWKHAGTAKIINGSFSFTISPSALGTVQYRAVRHPDGTHGYKASHPVKLQVVHRTLSLGDTGSDVLALEKRLRALHYDTGKVSSTYSIDTLHAVTAFEKVQGIDKDGEAGVDVWKALNHPKVMHLRHPVSSGYAVEVDLAKQVLIISKNGKIWRMLDTSTAGGYQFTGADGQTETAITPTGHFTIQYKITGWHKSSLGELYYPSYFTNTGYAIHGEGNGNGYSNVPPVPASHGCVRITNNAVLRYYYGVFTVGTSVWIYN